MIKRGVRGTNKVMLRVLLFVALRESETVREEASPRLYAFLLIVTMAKVCFPLKLRMPK